MNSFDPIAMPSEAPSPEPSPPPSPDTPESSRKTVWIAAAAGAGVLVIILAAIFGNQLYTRVTSFNVRVTPSIVEEGGNITVRWPVIEKALVRYPFERLSICRIPVSRNTAAKQCTVVLSETPNDGQESLTVSVGPGAYRIFAQALDPSKQPTNLSQLSNGFRVMARSGGSGDGGGGSGGGGGGSGGGGGGAPPPQPPPPGGPHGGAPPPAPPPQPPH
ncbi:MAG: hypothetical protein G01um1014106_656 [Parcubacteria group bacterium Gr01-1014_106]|nr:MAG: hypothetical protein G01um1014106_656 [Parcubacteria group bacterium Gr01-1014_106]